SDADALRAVEDLERLGISSGPSGASTLAGARVALANTTLRTAMDIGADATVVLLSTEANDR
ncbi:MAG: PLP-dependent lyase/thiolase, partial [Chloroflexota bacterium]|nr:PLP-dependent lyase/thiolase [Chloroflexota bacterium]